MVSVGGEVQVAVEKLVGAVNLFKSIYVHTYIIYCRNGYLAPISSVAEMGT